MELEGHALGESPTDPLALGTLLLLCQLTCHARALPASSSA